MNVKILDTTLREGEQTPGVSFTVEQKLRIAQALDRLGVDAIEVGHPGVSLDVDEFIRQVKWESLDAEIVVHSRTLERDVEAALSDGADRVAVFLGTSDLHLRYNLKTTPIKASGMVYSSIRLITESGVKARFGAEDASRAELDVLIELCLAAVDAGADNISISDTVGIATPDKMRTLVRQVKNWLPRTSLDVHCHNDLGLSVANSLAALEGGADCVHVTVNGLGERTGIAPLGNLAAALKVLYGIDTVDIGGIPEISRMVADFSGIPLPANQPIVGDNAFSHKAGIHSSGVLKNPAVYEPFPPDLVCRRRQIIVDKYAGKSAVGARLESLGLLLTDEDITAIVAQIKTRRHSDPYSDAELINLANTCIRNRRLSA